MWPSSGRPWMTLSPIVPARGSGPGRYGSLPMLEISLRHGTWTSASTPSRRSRSWTMATLRCVPAIRTPATRRSESLVSTVVGAGCIPVILGGDHSIAYPDIGALMAHHEPGSVAVVQFDTHTDTATENWGVEWSHGTPFRHLVDDGVIPGERLVQVGLRGYWPFVEEFDWARGAGVRWHRMAEVTDRGIDAVMQDVLEETAEAQHLFLSVDVDVLDPAYAPGTGTPEPGGMTTRELLEAVGRLARQRSVAGSRWSRYRRPTISRDYRDGSSSCGTGNAVGYRLAPFGAGRQT